MDDLTIYIKQPETIERFSEMLGKRANSYVQSVLIAVQSSEELMKCTKESIVNSALRAASLGLSCDPAQKEAHLVPRNRKIKGKNGQPDAWEKVACFEPHYLGLYKLAMRTGKYWTINVVPVMKGQEVKMGIDGLHYIFEGNMKVDHFPVSRVTAKNMGEVVGWLGYFKTTRGFEKTAYMSVDEIMEHAATFSQSYKRDIEKNTRFSNWNNPDVLPTMQMKTVLRDLLNWADTSGDAGAALREALENTLAETDPDVIEAEEVSDVPVTESEPQAAPESLALPRINRDASEVLEALVDHRIAENVHEARNIMDKCKVAISTLDKFVSWATVYRGWRDSGKDPRESAERTNNGERPI